MLLKESVDGLNIQSGGIYVDVTFGGGGHSREILSRLSEGAHLYSFAILEDVVLQDILHCFFQVFHFSSDYQLYIILLLDRELP